MGDDAINKLIPQKKGEAHFRNMILSKVRDRINTQQEIKDLVSPNKALKTLLVSSC